MAQTVALLCRAWELAMEAASYSWHWLTNCLDCTKVRTMAGEFCMQGKELLGWLGGEGRRWGEGVSQYEQPESGCYPLCSFSLGPLSLLVIAPAL